VFHLGLSYYRNLVATSFLSFWLGLEFGLQSFENEEDFDVLLLPSGDTVDGRELLRGRAFSHARCSYPFRCARLGRPLRGRRWGLYHMEFDESFSGYSDDIEEDSAAGGFVNAGVEILIGETGMGVRIEHQVHFFEFEGLSGVLPGDPDIDGPMQVSRVGFIYRF